MSDEFDAKINSLRDHMDQRISGIERWLERVSTAIDKLAENRERISVAETKLTSVELLVAQQAQDMAKIKNDLADHKIKTARIFGMITLVGLLAGIILPLVLKSYMGG